MIISIEKRCGSFAENKDQAREIRNDIIGPCLARSETVVLDFKGVDSTTQSFIHALISSSFQEYGESALDQFEFKNCTKAVKSLLTTVINYSLE